MIFSFRENSNNHKKKRLNSDVSEKTFLSKSEEAVEASQKNEPHNRPVTTEPQPLLNNNKKSKIRMKKVTKKSKWDEYFQSLRFGKLDNLL